MKVAIYLRKSRSDGVADMENTLQTHKKILLETAKKQSLTILHIYEEVVSGDSLFSRPQMLRLLETVEQGAYDGVLCMDIDRLGRGGMRDQGIILDTFKNSHTKIITPDKTYDLNNEDDEELTEFKSFLSRRELKIIKKRLQRGLNETIKNGGYVSNPPFGYESDYKNKTPTLRIVPEEAEYVKIIFHFYVYRNMGSQQIANYLNSMGVSPRRSTTFGRTSVLNILKNPVYTGRFVRNKSKLYSTSTQIKCRTLLPKDDWNYYNGVHPRIIDDALFEKAQEILERHSKNKTTSSSLKNPLAGLLLCANCKKKLQRYTVEKKYEYLACPSKGCPCSTQLSLVENAVLLALNDTMSHIQIKFGEASKHSSVLSTAQKHLTTELGNLAKQKEAAYHFLERGIYDTATFASRQKAIDSKIKTIKKQLAEFQTEDNIRLHESLPSYPKNLLELYDSCSPKDKNLLLKNLVEQIEFFKQPNTPPEEFELKMYVKFPFHR